MVTRLEDQTRETSRHESQENLETAAICKKKSSKGGRRMSHARETELEKSKK